MGVVDMFGHNVGIINSRLRIKKEKKNRKRIDFPHGYSKRTLIADIIKMWVLFEFEGRSL